MLGSRSRRTLSPPTSAGRDRRGDLGLGRAVDGRRIAPLVAHLHAARRARRRRPRRRGGSPVRAHRAPPGRTSGWCRAARPVRDHVPGVAAVDLRDADDRAVQRVDVAAGDRLQPVDDLRRGDDRVDAEMRHRGMRAASADGDLEDVEGRHHRAGADRELADRQTRASCACRRPPRPDSGRARPPRSSAARRPRSPRPAER